MKILISNYIRFLAFAYDPTDDKILNAFREIADILKKGDFKHAKQKLHNYTLQSTLRSRIQHWGHQFPDMKNALSALATAIRRVDEEDPHTLQTVERIIHYLEEVSRSAPVIKHLQMKPKHTVYSYDIPKEWEITREKIKEKSRGDVAPDLLRKEKAEDIKRQLIDRIIKRPGLFLRDLHRIISYIEKEIDDPTKHGLVQDLSKFVNDVSAQARKGEVPLPVETQTNFITKAQKLQDVGTLLSMLSGLFTEQYKIDTRPTKKILSCIAQILRSLVAGVLVDNLKEIQPFLGEETPDEIKTLVNKIIRQNPDSKELEKIHDTIKTAIKNVRDPDRRIMFQTLILKPIQFALGKIGPTDLDIPKRIGLIKTLKDFKKEKNTQNERAQNLMQDTRTKGAPSSQISPHSQRIY